MPSTITHTYIGLDTLKKVNTKPKSIINNHLNNYKVYCQSMDVLYFYHIFLLKENKVQKLAHSFHNQNVLNTFKMLINDNKLNKNDELFTFISGLITHYQADSIMHPYINYLSHNKKRIKEIDKHFEIETYIDNYYMKENNVKKYTIIYTKNTIIEDELNKVFNKLYNFKDMGKYYYKALKEMSFVYKYIRYDKYGIKRKMYSFIDFNPFNIRRCKYLSYHFNLNNNDYYLNLSHKTWFNYRNKKNTSSKSFLELYDEVIDKASFIINELYSYIYENKKVDLDQLIKNISYSSGLLIA